MEPKPVMDKENKVEYHEPNGPLTVHIFMDDDEVMMLSNIHADPFEVGDVIWVSVDEPIPRDYQGLSKKMVDFIKNTNEEKREKYHLKKVKLIEKRKFLNNKSLREDAVTIEYECRFTEDENDEHCVKGE